MMQGNNSPRPVPTPARLLLWVNIKLTLVGIHAATQNITLPSFHTPYYQIKVS